MRKLRPQPLAFLMGVRVLPFFEVDVGVPVLLIFFDLSLPGLVRLFRVRPVRLLARVIRRRFARIFLVWHLAPCSYCPHRPSCRDATRTRVGSRRSRAGTLTPKLR